MNETMPTSAVIDLPYGSIKVSIICERHPDFVTTHYDVVADLSKFKPFLFLCTPDDPDKDENVYCLGSIGNVHDNLSAWHFVACESESDLYAIGKFIEFLDTTDFDDRTAVDLHHFATPSGALNALIELSKDVISRLPSVTKKRAHVVTEICSGCDELIELANEGEHPQLLCVHKDAAENDL